MQQRSSRKATRPPKPAVGALDAGLRLLARRAHARAELRTKLKRRGHSGEDVERALGRLAELGYLDDSSFAEGHVRRRQAALGPLALSRELASRGVDRAVTESALARFDTAAQLASATRLAERLCARSPSPGYREMLNTVGAKLLRRGFTPAVARAACLAAWRGAQPDPEA
ncbi:MAG TPA: RecX family transcriptional regulator [Patescibacteria group bacterium]|nr:RecX family transcriptional regulator [Patescibacteria group bacterium]